MSRSNLILDGIETKDLSLYEVKYTFGGSKKVETLYVAINGIDEIIPKFLSSRKKACDILGHKFNEDDYKIKSIEPQIQKIVV